jgi:hypothetical protein
VVSVTPSSDVISGSTVEVSAQGAPVTPSGSVIYGVCVVPVGPTLGDSQCRESGPLWTDEWGSGQTQVGPVRASMVVGAGATIDCRTTPCGFGLFDGEGGRIVSSAPLTFAPPATLTVEPAEGLLDGETMTVTGTNIPPGTFRLHHCAGQDCDEGQLVTVDPTGALDAELPAQQRVRATSQRYVYCRSQCVVDFAAAGLDLPTAGYTMAEGQVTVVPSDGLVDGQTVEVTGSDLMPTYAGPTFGVFPTGGWALTQCDAAVLDAPSLLGVFTHCAAPPLTRPVTVDASTLDATLDVAATITKILGGTTDCTTPEACVAGLVRFEQDATLTTHLTPLAFAR